STEITSRAPRCSRQSVNPPVEAPTSRALRPLTSSPDPSSAFASLIPPRDTNGGRSGTPRPTAQSPSPPRLAPPRPARPPATPPRRARGWGARGGREQHGLGQQGVQPALSHCLATPTHRCARRTGRTNVSNVTLGIRSNVVSCCPAVQHEAQQPSCISPP